MFRSESLSTINSTFMAAVDEAPDRTYFDFSGETYSYARMATEVERLARGLHALGIRPDDRVVTLLENGPDAIICWYAINWLGAIHVPINTAYIGDFLSHQINDSGARIVICENDYVSRVTALAGRIECAEHILYLGTSAEPGEWRSGFIPLDECRLNSGEAPFADVAPEDLTAIIYTSGTTGLSKGCMASHAYFCDLSRRYAQCHGRTADDIHWTPMPLFHIAGICVPVAAMQLRASAAVSRKFSVSGFWHEIERSQATIIMLMGSMAQMIADASETEAETRCRGQLRTLIATPMTAELAQAWKDRFGVKFVTGLAYGSTECGLALTGRYDAAIPQGSCGRVNDAFDVRVVDQDDQELPPGEVGEIVTRPKRPHVMFSGYWKNSEATVAVTRNLWFHTGDQARVDEEGNFFFVDRKKDVIRRRGENISSFELEVAIGRHPEVAEIAIHAVASDVSEDDVKATVVLAKGARLTELELLEWARPRIPKFALPRYIEFRDGLPRNPLGRVLKFQLREDGVTGKTWDREKKGVRQA